MGGVDMGKLEFCAARDETFVVMSNSQLVASYCMSFPHLRPFRRTSAGARRGLRLQYSILIPFFCTIIADPRKKIKAPSSQFTVVRR